MASESAKNAREIAEEILRAKNEMEELTFASRDFANEASKAAKAFFDNNIQVAETRKAFKDIAKTISETSMNIEGIITGQKDISEVVKNQVKYEQNKKKLASELSQALGKNLSASLDMEKVLKGEATVAGQLKDQFKKMTPEQQKLVKLYHEQFKALQLQDKEMEEMGKRAEKIEGGMGRFGKGVKGLGGVLKKVGLGGLGKSMGLDKAVEEGRLLSASLTKGGKNAATMGTKLKVAGKMAGSMAGSLDKAFTLLAVKKLFTLMKDIDGAAGDFAKNQGISYNESIKLRGEMSKVAEASDDILVSSKGLMETQGRLNQLMGSNVRFSDELASDMTLIAKTTNMSAESQEILAFESIKTGKSAKDLLKSQKQRVLQLNKEKGLTMSVKQIQDQVGKSSKSIQMNFKGSGEELIKQVMSAKALGTNLSAVEGIASSLLDFESSIQAELEAELLLGKDINLEKARQAALEGDMGKVADEVLKNKAIMNAFDTKNVIAQEAAAKALGMNREQLAGMIKEQKQLEVIKDSGFKSMDDAQTKYNEMIDSGMSKEEAASKIKDKDLLTQLESASIADRLAATMERVSEVFIEMSTPVLAFVDGLMKSEGIANKIANIIKGIAAAYLLIKGLQVAMNVLSMINISRQSTLLGIEVAKAGAATTTNAMTTFGIGTVIAVAAVAAAMGAVGMYFMNDGMIGSDGGMVVSGPKGSIQLNKDDEIIAGTDLMGKGQDKDTNKDGRVSREERREAREDRRMIKEMMKQMSGRNIVIEMNGNQVGQGINTSDRSVQ
tara:strand:+ start:1238 stop:3583 length:2346 start_codon:yes stop_codon:yes gene_type:complete